MNLETLDWDDELLVVLRHPARDAAADPPVVRARPVRRHPRRRPGRRRGPADRRARRPAGGHGRAGLLRRRARRRTPTAPATSCCSTPARSWSAPATACSPRSATSSARRRRSTPWRARSRSPARPCSGCATSSASSAAPAEIESAGPPGRRQRRRLLRPGVLRPVRAVLALATPAARSSGCPGSTPTPTWPGPRSRRSATRAATWPRRWSRTPASHLEVLKVDGGVTANDLCMQIQADILGVDVVPPGRRRDDRARARPTPPASAVGFWKDPEDLRQNWQEDRRWSPAVEPGAARRRLRRLDQGGPAHPGLGGRLVTRAPARRTGSTPGRDRGPVHPAPTNTWSTGHDHRTTQSRRPRARAGRHGRAGARRARHRRRRHRRGLRPGRGDPRADRRPGRGPRLRRRHVQPVDQAVPRRPALPRAARTSRWCSRR